MNFPTNPADNLAALIQCPSVTPDEGGALTALEAMLAPMGFSVERPLFHDADTPDIENLYARRSGNGPHLMFAGHTDVVPTGDESEWKHPPFSAAIDAGEMYGRGAVDMKGGIACFIAAVARHIEKHGKLNGSVSFLITGDEEGPAINGTVKLLQWAKERGESWDASLVGEPTNPNSLGDMIKVGRRGSLSGTITVHGVQGHAAYPHLAENPVRGIVTLVDALLDPVFDNGTANFQASNMEVTTIDVGNKATNVIPSKATASFNIRFNDTWTPESLQAEIKSRLEKASNNYRLRSNKKEPVNFELIWKEPASHVFVTKDEKLIDALSGSIETVMGKRPELSTSGGTSDARLIKDYCPVVEFGLVGKTMHMTNERVALADLEQLTQIYEQFIVDFFR